MAKKALVILLVFCWLIGGCGVLTGKKYVLASRGETKNRVSAKESVFKGECSLQIKNYSGKMIDI